jgi:prefoldin subunit 5
MELEAALEIINARVKELERKIEYVQAPRIQERLYDLLALNRYLQDLLTGKIENLNMKYKHLYCKSLL